MKTIVDRSTLLDRYGKSRVFGLEASLRQLEKSNPNLFQAVISNALMEGQEIPNLPALTQIVLDLEPSINPEVAETIASRLASYLLAQIAGEALL